MNMLNHGACYVHRGPGCSAEIGPSGREVGRSVSVEAGLGGEPGGEVLPRRCAWCLKLLPATAKAAQVFCTRKCRQWAFRLRRRRTTDARNAQPMRFAYADPPYVGLARRYYQHEESYGGEVDHAALIAQLEAGGFDGWALSASAKSLRVVLPLCPEGLRVAAWTKPHPPSSLTYGPHNCWEPLIVVGGRKLRPGFRDWICTSVARGGGELMGRKPIAFCSWLFEQLGMLPGDELVDLFPGSGVVSRAWAELSRSHRGDASPEYSSDVSPAPGGNASPGAARDASAGYRGDVSSGARADGAVRA